MDQQELGQEYPPEGEAQVNDETEQQAIVEENVDQFNEEDDEQNFEPAEAEEEQYQQNGEEEHEGQEEMYDEMNQEDDMENRDIAAHPQMEPEDGEVVPPAPIPIPGEEKSRSSSKSPSRRSRSRSRSSSPSKNQSKNGQKQPDKPAEVDKKTKFYVGRIHTDTREEELRNSFDQFGEILEVKIIKKSYTGQPLQNTYFAFVVIWLDCEAQEVIDYFENTEKDKGWKVSLAKKENNRDDSPRRR